MTKYLEPSFHHFAVGSDDYRKNWDEIFKKNREEIASAQVEPPKETELEYLRRWERGVRSFVTDRACWGYESEEPADVTTALREVLAFMDSLGRDR